MTENNRISALAVDKDTLRFNDPPVLIWVKVQEAVNLLWQENPKLHDIGGTMQSIARHGFQDLPKFDSNLPNVAGEPGAIKSGNGRIECLALMEKDSDYQLPRGLATHAETGEWVLPLVIGTDAASLDMARSYAIDANNLTLAGGNFTAWDMAGLWDKEKYLELLAGVNTAEALPVSVTAEDLDDMLRAMGDSLLSDAPEDFKEYDDGIETDYCCPKCGYEWSGKPK